jgi:biopolymer transport protein TolR
MRKAKMSHDRWRASAASQRRVAKRASRYYTGTNLFSMVGVGFALFIINMIITPAHRFMGQNLTKLNHAGEEAGAVREDAIVLAIARDGRVFQRTSQIEGDEIAERIRDRVGSGSERKVYLQADARAKTGDVNTVVNEIQGSGVTHIAILTDMPVPHR